MEADPWKWKKTHRPYAVEVFLRLRKLNIERAKNKSNRAMRQAILKRIPSGTLIMKQMKENPEFLKLIIFKETKNFFMRMEHFVPEIYAEWENKNDSTIVVDVDSNEFSGIEQSFLKPLNVTSKEELMTGARNLVSLCDSIANCTETTGRVDELKNSVMEVANFLYDDKDIKTYLYGSRFTGLAQEDADVNLYVEVDCSFCGSLYANIEFQRSMVERFVSEMRCRPSEFEEVCSVTDVQIPTLKFKHNKTNLRGEIEFRSGISTQISKLVKLYMDLDQRVKFVLCGVKYWFAKNGLNDPIYFPPIVQTWLVLYYLVQVDLIPAVEELRDMMPLDQRIYNIENWNCALPNIELVRSSWKSSCFSSSRLLLEGFFTLYSQIPVERFVLCSFDGFMRRRKKFFKGYHELKFDRELHAKVQQDYDGFCVQDPFDRFKNLTMNLKKKNTRKVVEFVELCKETEELLEKKDAL